MAVYKADAIVIRSREYGEADRLVTLFAREKGKINALAKGVRKPTSSQRAGTQLFTYADFLLHQGKTLDTITQAQPRESFPHIWSDLDRTLAASGMAELLDISTANKQPEPELFTLTLTFLFMLKFLDPYIALAGYALKLLGQQGYLPSMDSCTGCGRDLAEEQVFFNVDSGFLCTLGHNKQDNRQIAKALCPGSIAFMKQLTKVEPAKLDRLRWQKRIKEEILDGLRFFCEAKFERKLQAWRQIEEMTEGQGLT